MRIRARIGKAAYEIDVQEQCCGGLNFGYSYNALQSSRMTGSPHPAYTVQDFAPSTVPGCRAPHLWLKDRRSLYDAFGSDTRSSASIAAPVRGSASSRSAARRTSYRRSTSMLPKHGRHSMHRNLVLVRPDQHVAWRGNKEPSDPMGLIDLVRGSRSAKDLR